MPGNIRFESDSPDSSDEGKPRQRASHQRPDISSGFSIIPARQSSIHQSSAFSRTRSKTPPPRSSETTWYDHNAGVHRPRADPYNPEMARQLEEGDMKERVMRPHEWYHRIEDMQTAVWSTSALQLFLSATDLHQRVPVPFPEEASEIDSVSSFVPHDVGVADTIARSGPVRAKLLRHLLDSVAIAVRALINLEFLRGDRFMSTSISAFVQDRNRHDVAKLVTIQYMEMWVIAKLLDDVLRYEITDSTAVTWAKPDLFDRCSLFLSKFWGMDPMSQLEDGQLWLLTARTMDLAVVSYCSAHVGSLAMDGITPPTQVIDLLPSLVGTRMLRCRKRRLACLDAFLNGETAWVFEAIETSEETYAPPLYISTTMQEVADIFGPAWKALDPSDDIRNFERQRVSAKEKLSTSYQMPTVTDANSSDTSDSKTRYWVPLPVEETGSPPRSYSTKQQEEAKKKFSRIEHQLEVEQTLIAEAFAEEKAEIIAAGHSLQQQQQMIKALSSKRDKELARLNIKIDAQKAKLSNWLSARASQTSRDANAQHTPKSYIQSESFDRQPLIGATDVSQSDIPAQYFHLGHGLVLPWEHSKGDPSVESDETLCHWTSDIENLSRWKANAQQKIKPKLLRAQDRLLIGANIPPRFAAGKALLPNASCRREEAAVYQNLRREDVLKPYRVAFPAYHVDATAVNATFGFHGIGIGGQRSFKRKDGTFLREEFTAIWTFSNNPTILRAKYGLEISFCTRHARRVSIFHLLCSSTMRNCLQWSGYQFPDTECKDRFYSALQDESVADFKALQDHSLAWRTAVNNAVSTCLAEIDKLDKGDSDWIHAYWVPNGETLSPCSVRLNKDVHDWAELVADTPITGAFTVISNECLKLDRENESCGACSSAVLETAVTVNPFAMLDDRIRVRQERTGGSHWHPSHFCTGNRLRLKEGEIKVVKRLRYRLHAVWKGQVMLERYQRDKGRPRHCHWEALPHEDAEAGMADCIVPIFLTRKGIEITNATVIRTNSPAQPVRTNSLTRPTTTTRRPPPASSNPNRGASVRSGATEGTEPSRDTTTRGTQPEMSQRSASRSPSPKRIHVPVNPQVPTLQAPTANNTRPQRTGDPAHLSPHSPSLMPSPSPRTSHETQHRPTNSRTHLNTPQQQSPARSPSPPARRRRHKHKHRHRSPRESNENGRIPSNAGTWGGYQSWGDASYGRGRDRNWSGAGRRSEGFWSRLLCLGGSATSELR